MGITINSNNYSLDIGYSGFMHLRKRIAMCVNENFGNHYSKLNEAMFICHEERDEYFKKYNKETDKFVECGIVSNEIANFCYQPDCEGSINQKQSKQIYEIIKDYDDEILYGYSGREDCAMFKDFKLMFKDCADNGGDIEWW